MILAWRLIHERTELCLYALCAALQIYRNENNADTQPAISDKYFSKLLCFYLWPYRLHSHQLQTKNSHSLDDLCDVGTEPIYFKTAGSGPSLSLAIKKQQCKSIFAADTSPFSHFPLAWTTSCSKGRNELQNRNLKRFYCFCRPEMSLPKLLTSFKLSVESFRVKWKSSIDTIGYCRF